MPGQGKAGKAGPGQTKPRLGTTGKPAKPKQGVWSLSQLPKATPIMRIPTPKGNSGGCQEAADFLVFGGAEPPQEGSRVKGMGPWGPKGPMGSLWGS